MREYIGSARNLGLSITGDKLTPVAEVVVITSEPRYAVDYSQNEAGTIVKNRAVEALRFSVNQEGLKDLIANLQDLLGAMKSVQVTATAVSDQPEGA